MFYNLFALMELFIVYFSPSHMRTSEGHVNTCSRNDVRHNSKSSVPIQCRSVEKINKTIKKPGYECILLSYAKSIKLFKFFHNRPIPDQN